MRLGPGELKLGILAALAAGCRTHDEIAEHIGTSHASVRARMSQLLADGVVRRSPMRFYGEARHKVSFEEVSNG